MSSFKGFTPEELAALTPWRLPVMGEAGEEEAAEEQAASTVEEVTDIPAIPTAEEIEAMQKQAYEEASAAGYRDGTERGYQEGRDRGYREGFAQGHGEGLQQGREKGRAEGLDAMQATADRFETLISDLDEPYIRLDEQVENELVALVIAIARQLIRRELKTDPGQIIAVVREAVAVLPSASRKISLHLHPEDAELIRSTLSLDEGGPRWKISEDPLMTRGGCRITTETSHVDATVEKRLTAVIARLLGGEREEDRA